MAPSEAEILDARLARMKYLIDALEKECAASSDLRPTLLKLRQELDAARVSIQQP